MEFFQFHPTGIYKMGILLSEAARGEGAILRNRTGERFMERYAPTLLDLAPRDMVSRAMYREIREGRGIDGKNYLHLDLTHLSAEVLDKKLPDITDFVRTYMGLEPEKGARARAADGALRDGRDSHRYRRARDPRRSKHAAAAATTRRASRPVFPFTAPIAWAQIHWSTSSFTAGAGRAARGNTSRRTIGRPCRPMPTSVRARQISRLLAGSGKERAAQIRDDLQDEMMDKASVFREAKSLGTMKEKLAELRQRFAQIRIEDRGVKYNTELLEAIELGNLLDLAEVLVESALAARRAAARTRARTSPSATTSIG